MKNDDRIRYVSRPKGRDRWSRRRRRPSTASLVGRFIANHTSGGTDCRVGFSETQGSHGVQWSGKIVAATAEKRARDWLAKAEGADVLHVEANGEELQIRAVMLKGYRLGEDTNPHIAAFHEFILNKLPRAVSWGIFSCRNIAGTNTYSGHAWKCAEDFHGPRLIMAQIARLAVKYHKRFNLVVVIYNGRVWTPSAGWHTYTGSCPHKQHVHVNVPYPTSKTPPCAR